MPVISNADFIAMQQRCERGHRQSDASGGSDRSAVSRESDLHDAILAECSRRSWLALHGSMAHRTHRTAGEFDFVILADGGKTLYVECKTKTGKLTTEQQALHAWARKLRHNVFVVRSLSEFLDALQVGEVS